MRVPRIRHGIAAPRPCNLERATAYNVLPYVDINSRLDDVLGYDLHVVHGEKLEERGRGVIEAHPDRVAVDHLGGFRHGTEQSDSGPRLPWLDHPVDTEGHILGGQILAIPPLDVLVEMEDVGQPAIAHRPALGQVPDDFPGVKRVKLNHLVIEGADR